MERDAAATAGVETGAQAAPEEAAAPAAPHKAVQAAPPPEHGGADDGRFGASEVFEVPVELIKLSKDVSPRTSTSG